MQQLDLFDDEGPQPIQRWLHVWSDAERERRIKKARTVGCEPCGLENPPKRAEETSAVMRPSVSISLQRTLRDELP